MSERELIMEYIGKLQEPTDEEIVNLFEEWGVTDVNPENVRKYIRECIHNMYCRAVRMSD